MLLRYRGIEVANALEMAEQTGRRAADFRHSFCVLPNRRGRHVYATGETAGFLGALVGSIILLLLYRMLKR